MEDIKNLYRIQQPDGLFASVERLAISAMRVAKNEGIRIPSELKLICFSCLDIADLLEPALSVVKQPAYEMGKMATEYLCQLIAKPIIFSNQEVTYLESSLIFQKSSKKNH
ncbi:HTH-type transcriptional repressor CytR [compost metagenome]